jgi:hypothetical protein
MRSPVLEKATTEGVVRAPSGLGITMGSEPSKTATQELVVPRSIPMIFAIIMFSFLYIDDFELNFVYGCFLKVFEIPKNFFQKVLWRGSGQSPVFL